MLELPSDNVPKKRWSKTGLGTEPVCDHMDRSACYRDGRKLVLGCRHFAQPIAQRVQQEGHISFEYDLRRGESVKSNEG
jgi:hypothetical protein